MKSGILVRFTLVAVVAGAVFACSKSTYTASNNAANETTAIMQTQADDQARVSVETDAALDDVNLAMASDSSVIGAGTLSRYGVTINGGSASSLICDATIDTSSTDSTHTITITYNGTTGCSAYRTRTGTIVVSVPDTVSWGSTDSATITVNIQNLKITRISDGKFITLNGTRIYKNISGGTLSELMSGTDTVLVHSDSCYNMQVTFDDGTQRSWSAWRQRTFTYANQDLSIATLGLYNNGGHSGLSEWGTTRQGLAFATQIISPLTVQSSCSYQLTNGELSIIRSDIVTYLTFGLTSAGDTATSCPGSGSFYYYQAQWVIASTDSTKTYIAPY